MELTDKRVEGTFSQGWPFAIIVTLMVAASFATAWFVHQRTYRSPNDVTAEYRSSVKSHGSAEGRHEAGAKAATPEAGH